MSQRRGPWPLVDKHNVGLWRWVGGAPCPGTGRLPASRRQPWDFRGTVPRTGMLEASRRQAWEVGCWPSRHHAQRGDALASRLCRGSSCWGGGPRSGEGSPSRAGNSLRAGCSGLSAAHNSMQDQRENPLPKSFSCCFSWRCSMMFAVVALPPLYFSSSMLPGTQTSDSFC